MNGDRHVRVLSPSRRLKRTCIDGPNRLLVGVFNDERVLSPDLARGRTRAASDERPGILSGFATTMKANLGIKCRRRISSACVDEKVLALIIYLLI